MNVEQILQEIFYTGDPDARPCVKEAACVVEKHERAMYHMIEGERKPDLESIVRLSNYLVNKYKDTRLAEIMLPDGWMIQRVVAELNGRIDDEVQDIAVHQGKAIEAYQNGDDDTVISEASKVSHAANTMALESVARKGRKARR